MTDQSFCFLVKTFERPKALSRLLYSIRKYYPQVTTLVADDSSNETQDRNDRIIRGIQDLGLPVEHHNLAHNSGLSFGRNYLVGAAETEQVALLDDDFQITGATDISLMRRHVTGGTYDIVGGSLYTDGLRGHFEGFLSITGDRPHRVLKFSPLEQFHHHQQCDIVLNFLVARRDVLRSVQWDNNLKLVEHTEFFIRCKEQGVSVGHEPIASVAHHSVRTAVYVSYRSNREYLDWCKGYWMAKHGIERCEGTLYPRRAA